MELLVLLSFALLCALLVQSAIDREAGSDPLELHRQWEALTTQAQNKAYGFWFNFARHATRSRRVWSLGYRRFRRLFWPTLSDKVLAQHLGHRFIRLAWQSRTYFSRVITRTPTYKRPFSYAV